ncbi:MAG: alpha-L-fucosidase [Bacteroidaceae bacterium]|nr:alpha-L-fucosidase [Bacteroidaceae bacterium]
MNNSQSTIISRPHGERQRGAFLLKFLLILFFHFLILSTASAAYSPTPENLQHRQEFQDFRFGIFIHWGIYSTYAQGEWYLNSGINKDEYAKAADAFYPHRFDAREWVRAIKGSGARYITFTSRHHDGFSMWNTQQSDYNIVRATPFRRDVLRELSEACQEQGMALHLYYSILDWIRPDYPLGRTGHNTGRVLYPNYDEYFSFMKRQVSELLTQYGPIGALWFDGYWDHDSDTIPFDWRMPEFYRYCHSFNPALLIGNNHHISPIEGEDFQMFERDLPGENTAGLSGQDISPLPLEMCQTMNGMWGYKVSDINYKSAPQLIQLIVRAAGKGSNLLLNIGPQPNGELPHQSLERLEQIGAWMKTNGHTIYGTHRTPIGDQPWGTTTGTDTHLYLHVLDAETTELEIPLARKPKQVSAPSRYDKKRRTLRIQLPAHQAEVDHIVDILL